MPRAQVSRESAILTYFRTSPLATAQVVLNLAKDAVREREQRSEEGKAAAAKALRSKAQKDAAEARAKQDAGAKKPAAASRASVRPPAKKKSHHKKPPQRRMSEAQGTSQDAQVEEGDGFSIGERDL